MIDRLENPIDKLKGEFGHPATVLWRAIELIALNKIMDDISLGDQVLDLGCAEGKIAEIVFKDKKIIGLDNCWQLLSQNKNTRTYKALFLADGCHMPYKDKTFNTVFSNCVIEHIPALESLLNEIERILKPGGIFIFTVPSHEFKDFLFFQVALKKIGLKKMAGWYGNKRNALLSHFHCYSHEKWREILHRHNLKLTSYSYYMSKKAVMLWDFLAALFLVLNKAGIGALARKITLAKIGPFINKNSATSFYSGGGLLLIAKKNN